jgi:hypothetical protein
MKIDAQPTWLSDIEPTALNSLSLNDKRNREGSDEIIVNPAYEDISDDRIFDRIEEILSTVYLTERLRKIEDDNRSKFGPRSIAKDWEERKDSLYAYFRHEDYDPGNFFEVKGRLRPLSIEIASSKLIKSSSAGLPYMSKKGLILNDAVNNYKSQVNKFPCVLYTRTQEKGKTRNVWGYPVSDTLQEQSVFQPYLAYERTQKHRAALQGPAATDLAVSLMLNDKREDEIIVTLDFSAFDASVAPSLSHLCFASIASRFQHAHAEEIYRLYRRFITIPIWTPDGEIVGPHGVPSGSSFTNTVDSLAQWIASGQEYDCQIQGDDGLYRVQRGEYDSLLDRMKSYGFIVNEEKSDVFEDKEGSYLQRYYSQSYPNNYGSGLGGVYSAYRALARIKYLERWTNFSSMGIEGSDFFALRTITILENCKHHPAFTELVIYVHSLDKFGLKYTKAGLDAYSRSMTSKARAGIFNQYGLEEGIENFETVKILKSL